jgi:hypothetical protein
MRNCLVVLLLTFSSAVFAGEEIYGVWKLSTANGEVAPSEFYMKLNENGIVETWPIPACWGTEKTSKGKYRLTKKQFIIETGNGNMKSNYSLKNNTLTITGSVETVYLKENNPPLPGELKAKSESAPNCSN